MSRKQNKEFKYPKDDSFEISTKNNIKKKQKNLRKTKSRNKTNKKINKGNTLNNHENKENINSYALENLNKYKSQKEVIDDSAEDSDYQLNEEGKLIKTKEKKRNNFDEKDKINSINSNLIKEKNTEITSNELNLYYDEYKKYVCSGNNNIINTIEENNNTNNIILIII